ncbi:MAG: cyclic lactone autoinducer peptide [Ignavibacteriales bacterium]
MKKLINLLAGSLAAFLVFVANYGVGPNSIFFWHEPDIPSSLKK